ncbi:MAG TPA: SDR family NAD(P)-dependent oxidoreductase [Hyphomicrobiales bacterium]|nr:SDR family NAD(P)-dependent oxidoreductase [Hyphomicrobiales bacterium]
MTDNASPVVLITGATDGLGQALAERLAAQGARLLLHGRNAAKGEAVVAALRQRFPGVQAHYFNADLASLQQVRELAAALTEGEARLDVLVNNAGVGPLTPDTPRRLSMDGHELFFAVNYLAGYALTHALLPLLRQSAPARVVNVASIGQQALEFDNLMLERDYDDARAYRQSKLAQILFTFDLAEQLEGSGVSVNCLHPATLMNTGMVSNSSYFPGPMTSLEQGVEALEHLVLGADVADVNGAYFDGLQPARANDQAYDAQARQRLRELSEALCG